MMLQDQVAIVTGAARGIGKGISLTLAREGAKVVIADSQASDARQAAQELEKMGLGAKAIPVDVTRSDQVDHLIQSVASQYGRIDILVNNAAVESNKPILELPEEEWDRTIAVDLKGVFLCSKSAAQVMVARHSGRIINIASASGKSGVIGQAAYCAAKWGVIGLTKVLALELAPHGINVNAVCPGSTETETMWEVFKRRAERQGKTLEQVAQVLLDKTPLGRFAQPEDIAQTVLFLASPMSAYITGIDMDVDGGRRAYLP